MEALKKLGLTKYEVAVYTGLLERGRCTAIELSEYSKVPPTAVYPNLKSLIRKQLVQQIKGKPSLFEPINPSISIKYLAEKRERELSQFKEEAISYAEGLTLHKTENVKKEILRLTHGKEFSREVYSQAFPRAKKTFYILGWRLEKVGDKYNLLKKFKELVKRKVDVRIILTGSLDKKWEVVKDYIEEGIKVRYLPLDNFSIFILDSVECKITLKDRALMDRFNIQILDKSLAKAMHSYFLKSWKEAKEIGKL